MHPRNIDSHKQYSPYLYTSLFYLSIQVCLRKLCLPDFVQSKIASTSTSAILKRKSESKGRERIVGKRDSRLESLSPMILLLEFPVVAPVAGAAAAAPES